MPTPDFDKIWASTSPLTPYSFSESNYKEGWNFIGGTPPARQMWDSIQKQNDEKMQYLKDNYAPLDSPALIGNPTAPTQDDDDDSTKLATTEFVDNVFLAKIISKLQETETLPVGTSFPTASVLSQMISKMNTEDGVVYDLSNSSAWYICLGAKYGNLIIQGGIKEILPNNTNETQFPITFATSIIGATISSGSFAIYEWSVSKIKIRTIGNTDWTTYCFWIVFGH